MSISTAMAAGTAGMRANASAMAAISDNIANLNTVGYKRLRNDFTALINAQNAATSYNAGGVLAGSRAMIGEQGALQASSVFSHLAVSGSGFFVTRERADTADANDPYFYTRAGQFSPDSRGFLRNSAGFYLYGWPVVDDVVDNANPTDLSALQPVRVASIGGAAEASSRISLTANLQTMDAQRADAATYDSADPANNMASGTGIRPDFQTSVQIYDSLGGLREVTFSFLRSATENQWHVEAHVQPESQVVTGAGLTNGQLAVGIVAFTALGELDPANTTLPTSLTIGAFDAAAAPGAGEVQWAEGLGIAAQTVELELGGPSATGGLTQFDAPSLLASSQVDGSPFGELSGIDIDSNGYVTALFANGLSKRVFQLPLATFSDPDSLIGQQGGVYRAGPDAGQMSLRAPGVAGAGRVQPRALESSTVDLAEEFSNLITTQRAYSASSKIITTADEMLDELIRMKR